MPKHGLVDRQQSTKGLPTVSCPRTRSRRATASRQRLSQGVSKLGCAHPACPSLRPCASSANSSPARAIRLAAVRAIPPNAADRPSLNSAKRISPPRCEVSPSDHPKEKSMNKRIALLAALAVVGIFLAFDVSAANALYHIVTTHPAHLLAATPVLAALPEGIQAELKRIGDDIKAHAEKADGELKAHARLTEETRAKVDELLTEQGKLQANLQHAQQALAKIEANGAGGDVQHQ